MRFLLATRFPQAIGGQRNCAFALALMLLLVPRGAKSQGSIADSVSTFLIDANLKPFLGFGCEIIQKGEPDYTFSYGYTTNENKYDWSDSTIFNLGSVSKLFTAIAVVKLAEEGLLKLDDPVYYHFPEFLEVQGRTRQAPMVTIMDLLEHRSGISQSMENLFPEIFGKDALQNEDQFYENTFNYRAFLSMKDFKERFLMYARIDHQPQRKYHFSNLNYVLLGYIVEEVMGINLGQLVTNKIFVPLEMHDSHYYQTHDSLLGRLAWGYYRLTDGSYLNVHENEVESPSPTGDGGIKTSMRDMRKFMKFLIGDINKPAYDAVISRSALLSMTAPLQKGPDKSTWVGLGFHNLQPYNFVGHAGGWDGFMSILYMHPESHSGLFLVTNREDNELFNFLRIYAAYAVLVKEFGTEK
jgi:CubicO group peptidase (beta-lactamase class C family)